MNIFTAAAMIVVTLLATVIAGLVTIVSAWKPEGEIADYQNSYDYSPVGAVDVGAPKGLVRQLTKKQTAPALIYIQTWLVVEVPSLLILVVVVVGLGNRYSG